MGIIKFSALPDGGSPQAGDQFAVARAGGSVRLAWATLQSAVAILAYDTTGAVDAGPALQALYDAGARRILIPPGRFLCNTPVFLDDEDGMATTFLMAAGVTFICGASLPTVSEWETFQTGHSLPTGTKVFLFPSTYRAALSGGVVTTVGHNVTGTATYGTTKSGIHPKLIVDGGTWTAYDRTGYNGAFVHTNLGGATELRSVHMHSARSLLLTGSQYVDGNKIYNCSSWAGAGDATYDMSVLYQYGNGDGVQVEGVKTAGFVYTATMYSCNGASIGAVIGGGLRLTECHGINIRGQHIEMANNITNTPRISVYVKDSQVTFDGGFDYLPDDSTQGAFYIDDSGSEGKHSQVLIKGWLPRHFMDPSTSDPLGGFAIYINKFNDRSIIECMGAQCGVTASDAAFGQAYGPIALPISGNATNEPTLAAAVENGRDLIAGGHFKIVKESTSTLSTGQNQAMTLNVRQLGNLGPVYIAKKQPKPTLYNNEAYGAVGTLTNGQAYAYAAAMCNTLPDGTIVWGAATAERLLTCGAVLKIIQEIYIPSGIGTLVVWRKAGTGVLATPDVYVKLGVARGSTRLFDTGANINKLPWIATSVPVPNTVAATDHTADGLYINGTAVTIP